MRDETEDLAETLIYMRISMNRDSDFSKSRTSISLSRGQRARSISASLVAVRGD